jgi:hypothetical protein
MTENTIKSPSVNGLTFRASGKVTKRHFMPKVVSRKVTVNDAFERHFRSSIATFIPKLSPKYSKPHMMLHVSNGASSCLIRFKNPEELVKSLEEIINTIRSDKWQDAWWRICDISEELINNNKINLDEEIVDINAWHKSLEDTIDVELVQVKKEAGGEK